MNEIDFAKWMKSNGYDESTIRSRISNCQRVSEYEGDLDVHYEKDECKSLLKRLKYSTNDKREGISPRHSIPINGDIYNGTATLRQAVNLYIKFRNNSHFDHTKNIDNDNKEIVINKKKVDIDKGLIKPKLDSYERFLKTFNISKFDLYMFGLNETIFPSIELVEKQWENLKERIYNNQEVSIRGAGRDAKGTKYYIDFYKFLFGNENVRKDPTNNLAPQKIIEELTGYKRNVNIYNYQVSHIFGRTKNIFMFEAAWNIVLVPKIIDPFTGHETKGIWPKEYQQLFRNEVFKKYSKYINEYNKILDEIDFHKKLSMYISNIDKENARSNEVIQFEKSVKREFSEIVK